MWKCVAQQRKTKEAEKEDYMREIMWQYEDKIITHLEYIEKFAYKNLPAEFIFSLNFCIGLIFFLFLNWIQYFWFVIIEKISVLHWQFLIIFKQHFFITFPLLVVSCAPANIDHIGSCESQLGFFLKINIPVLFGFECLKFFLTCITLLKLRYTTNTAVAASKVRYTT